ncbi:TetR/AcrR family transcriptional regulator [Streptomyces sp. DH37]|uniref:TetR/AcrR family transcriptional regulator n=1 Tax=Streptomyces sp. DH37 TaxID=3040122 RepID=UPI0024414BB8|nr:TetR family transcriptional regulator [Streptomyces sp. DH37]MDG9703104.1 TetR family transcriptional regulator [Streptomyces sp. DH37]
MAPARTPSSTAGAPALGLRERKKIRTRLAIRRAAYRLFAEQGYDATPVDRIAEAAEVSPSTVFRYFPTKEDIVLTDEYDPVVQEALRSRPAGEPPVRAVREALCEVLDRTYDADLAETCQRLALIRDVPAVRARLAEHTEVTGRLLRQVLSERTGRPVDDLELRVVTAAMLGALTEAMLHWADGGMRGDLGERAAHALDVLERGLTL